jgi:hypothetical protein
VKRRDAASHVAGEKIVGFIRKNARFTMTTALEQLLY